MVAKRLSANYNNSGFDKGVLHWKHNTYICRKTMTKIYHLGDNLNRVPPYLSDI